MPVFFVIISSSLYFKEKVWIKTTHFCEKYIKIVSKPMKHKTIGKPFCSYSHLLSVSMKKNIARTFFVCAGAQKGWETVVLKILYHNIYQIQKKIPSKIYIYIKYICLTFNWQNDFIKGFSDNDKRLQKVMWDLKSFL